MSKPDFSEDFFELGDKTSLLCADAHIMETVREALKDLGFKIHTAGDDDTALERLRYTQYNCIVIQENFEGKPLSSNGVLNYLAPLPMIQRRSSFICLVGESFKTLDAMQAFAQSVHVVVHPSDLVNLTAILKKGLAEFDMMYRMYRIALDMQVDRRANSRR